MNKLQRFKEMNAQTIILKALIKKYKTWFNLSTEEALSFILSNPEYFAFAFASIYYMGNWLIEMGIQNGGKNEN